MSNHKLKETSYLTLRIEIPLSMGFVVASHLKIYFKLGVQLLFAEKVQKRCIAGREWLKIFHAPIEFFITGTTLV
jgi:hypothetical protein